MHIENYDSPFHRAVESPTDRLIQEVKARYCVFLRDKLAEIKDIEVLEMSHPMMSCYVCVLLKCPGYQVRINYDMDKKQFAEPQIALGGVLSMENGYLFAKEELFAKIITIFARFYETSQIAGCGTTRGGEWGNKENTNQMARREYERLKEEHRKYLIRKQEEKEQRERREAENQRIYRQHRDKR